MAKAEALQSSLWSRCWILLGDVSQNAPPFRDAQGSFLESDQQAARLLSPKATFSFRGIYQMSMLIRSSKKNDGTGRYANGEKQLGSSRHQVSFSGSESDLSPQQSPLQHVCLIPPSSEHFFIERSSRDITL